jgi:hypothetical protein
MLMTHIKDLARVGLAQCEIQREIQQKLFTGEYGAYEMFRKE